MYRFLTIIVTTFSLIACNGFDKENSASTSQVNASIGVVDATTQRLTGDNLPIPDNRNVEAYRILFLGNSHVSGLPNAVKLLIQRAKPGISVETESGNGIAFLDERLADPSSVKLLTEQKWTHVVLQGQKYSQSGLYEYSTTETQRWIQLAKAQEITPILFPEHPQFGNIKEGRRVHELHESIAMLQSSCVAPVGLTWDEVFLLRPTLKLHQADGNHASSLGTHLTALVIYEAITGNKADQLPNVDNTAVTPEVQRFLKEVTTLIQMTKPACNYS